MNDLHKPVKILLKGWDRIEFPKRIFADGSSFTPVIPNDTLLSELIRIPPPGGFDPRGLDTYRADFLPQIYDYENQKLLRDYSSNLIWSLKRNCLGGENQSELDKFLRVFCINHGIQYEYHEFNILFRSYCTNILLSKLRTRDARTSYEKILKMKYGRCKTGADFMQVNSTIEMRGGKIIASNSHRFFEDFAKLSENKKSEFIEQLPKGEILDNNYKKIEEDRCRKENRTYEAFKQLTNGRSRSTSLPSSTEYKPTAA